MTDQRADTPRTAAGRALLEELGVTYPEQDWWLHYILAIEAEAAAEPAAAEPPDQARLLLDQLSRAVLTNDSESADAVAAAARTLLAMSPHSRNPAQPPRGSPSEKWVADQVGEPGMYEDEAGGSLTATERNALIEKLAEDGSL